MKSNPIEFRHTGLILACFCLLLAPLHGAVAATFDDLYVVSVAPDPEARDRRSDAIRRAMSLLLTRITGRQQAAAYPEMQDLINNADRYRDFYSELSDDEIRVGFIPTAINQALMGLNMPLWGDERPLTLLWIASDFGNGQRVELQALDAADDFGRGAAIRGGRNSGVLSNDLPSEIATFFEEVAGEVLTAADERGLPIVLPQLDAEDRRHVRFADVWGGFDRLVADAAERYDVDSVLIGRITTTEFGLEVKWTARRGDRRQTLTTPRARMGIDWLADEFASEFTTVGGVRVTRLVVRGIRNWSDAGIREYLESISIVETADIELLSGGEFVFRVTARGEDDSQLERLLALDGVLSRVENEEGQVYVPSWAINSEFIDSP